MHKPGYVHLSTMVEFFKICTLYFYIFLNFLKQKNYFQLKSLTVLQNMEGYHFLSFTTRKVNTYAFTLEDIFLQIYSL